MTEYIKRQDIHLALDRHYFPGELSLKETIDSVPAADVVERKKGKWMYKKITTDLHVVGQCSVCKERRVIDNFCPNCGADMREEEN